MLYFLSRSLWPSLYLSISNEIVTFACLKTWIFHYAPSNHEFIIVSALLWCILSFQIFCALNAVWCAVRITNYAQSKLKRSCLVRTFKGNVLWNLLMCRQLHLLFHLNDYATQINYFNVCNSEWKWFFAHPGLVLLRIDLSWSQNEMWIEANAMTEYKRRMNATQFALEEIYILNIYIWTNHNRVVGRREKLDAYNV